MFVELVDSLRCPRPHEHTWLVAAAEQTVARHIVTGVLGCPICKAEYPVVDGVAHFEGTQPVARAAPAPADPEDAIRLAAYLNLAEGSGPVLLAGRWGSAARALSALVPAPLLLVNPPTDVESQGAVSVLLTADRAPITAAMMRAAALDDALPAATSESLVVAVRPRGRVLGPASLALPPGLREVARDETLWVAEREFVPAQVIELRARRRGG